MHERGDVPAVAFAQTLRQQHRDVAAEHIAARVPENAFGRRVEDRDPVFLVGADDRVGGDGDDPREARLRFLQRELRTFDRGDVADQHEEAAHVAVDDVGNVVREAVA
ncbi:MAG TPA: hypothetical protein VFQ53_26675 [Kofleriaceae bacterium]|nr:hypothetical protein [Kofleriaceae bacterium]